MHIMSAREFYEVSGKDFILDKNSKDTKEIELYKKYEKADLDKKGVTYDEYLQYLADSTKGRELKIKQEILELARNTGIVASITDSVFDEERILRIGCLTADTEVQGKRFLKGSKLSFHSNGELNEAWLSGDTEIQRQKYPKGTLLDFDKNGSVRYIDLSIDIEIQGVWCKKGYLFTSLHNNGKLKKACLAKESMIGGKNYPKDTIVTFDENGKFMKAAYINNDGQRVNFNENGERVDR